MKLTLGDIRKLTLGHLDDPHGDQYGDRLDAYINETYQDIVNEVNEIPTTAYAEKDTERATVTTAAGTREYKVGEGEFSKIIEVRNNDGSSNPPAIDIVPYALRNDDLRHANSVYVFRNGADGLWYLGMVRMDPVWTSLLVHATPLLKKLGGAADVPVSVPADHHEALAWGATMLGLMDRDRDASRPTAMYEHHLNRIRRKITRSVEPNRAGRLYSR